MKKHGCTHEAFPAKKFGLIIVKLSEFWGHNISNLYKILKTINTTLVWHQILPGSIIINVDFQASINEKWASTEYIYIYQLNHIIVQAVMTTTPKIELVIAAKNPRQISHSITQIKHPPPCARQLSCIIRLTPNSPLSSTGLVYWCHTRIECPLLRTHITLTMSCSTDCYLFLLAVILVLKWWPF